MSMAAHHAEWISLVDVSGPFVSVPTLQESLPNGLDAHDPVIASQIREAMDVWADPVSGGLGLHDDESVRRAWVRFVLDRVLELHGAISWDLDVLERFDAAGDVDGGRSGPDAVLLDDDRPRLLVSIVAAASAEEGLAEESWSGSPRERMVEHLRSVNCRLGLVTDGERWTLVSQQPGENPGFATWWASLWREERLTLQAFRTLLGAKRFFSVPDDETLEGLLDRSADDQREITTKLGRQTLDAVEILVRTIDRIDRDRGGRLLQHVDESELYDASVTVMMRLIFLFFAEENDLLPVEEPLYVAEYAASTLRTHLQESADQYGEEVLETTADAWPRLLATWRAVYAGLEHAELRLVPYGGSLFDPDRYPFLEGRRPQSSWLDTAADPLPIDNRTVLHLLNALQTLEERGHRRKLSFRALDVEQIGHVYEGMLDHTATRADQWVLGLSGTGGKEPEIGLDELDSLDDATLLDRLTDSTGRAKGTTVKWLDADPGSTIDRSFALTWSSAFAGDAEAARRAERFAKFIRPNSVGSPTVFPPGSVYVCDSSHRGATGTHYTPRALTEEVVNHALEPLVHLGPSDGAPEEKWALRTPTAILDLTVCDPACGSGAFLVQACRYLADKLVESRLAHGELEHDPTEQDLVDARRQVAERCLHGVDINPMACEMAKLSLWLITLGRDLPFTFVDHAIRRGDSLLGITSVEQIERFSIDGSVGGSLDRKLGAVLGEVVKDRTREAVEQRRTLRSMRTIDVTDVAVKTAALRDADQALVEVTSIADRIVAVTVQATDLEDQVILSASEIVAALGMSDQARRDAFLTVAKRSRKILDRGRPASVSDRQPFHWPLEFPHVFARERGGFDSVIGNPPFVGGQRLTGQFGDDYREYLVETLGRGRRGSADLVAYFFLRAAQICHEHGSIGLLATNTIAQGDTREVGLDQLLMDGWVVRRAVRSRNWPGVANLEIAELWLSKDWSSSAVLDGSPTRRITSSLRPESRVTGRPHRLAANRDHSFIGSYVLGMGFVLAEEEAMALIEKDPRNGDVLFPYLNGKDLNSRPDQSPSRWVINFFDWSEERARQYPDCFEIVERRVRPERQRVDDSGSYVLRRPLPGRYWIYAEKRPALYRTISELERVLVITRVSRLVQPAFVERGCVMSEATVVFAYDDDGHFGLIASAFHWWWAAVHASTMRSDVRYTPTDCFETFAQPSSLSTILGFGSALDMHRRIVTLARSEGLTKTYNRVDSPSESSGDIVELRRLHVQLDHAVRDAYGWSDLELDHDFWETDYGTKFTLGPVTRQEVLDRLLELNHQRYAEEVARGLHGDDAQQLSFTDGGET